jgi:Rps23 Pro-64 3,4-dihydroxylase Tpa1-like proline 4-hydroxylase
MDLRSKDRREPFPHTSAPGLIKSDNAESALIWMETEAPWKLKITSFYEQWELHLDKSTMPPALQNLICEHTIGRLSQIMLAPITGSALELLEVTAHKLVPGQTIRIHNDYVESAESHRLLIQLNRGWSDRQGGILMIFGSSQPADIRRALKPIHCSGFAFEISPHSFHAVSTIGEGERFTLVYSFKARSRPTVKS